MAEDDEQAIPYAMRTFQGASLSSAPPNSSARNPSWLSYAPDPSLLMWNTLDSSSHVSHSLDQDQENKSAAAPFALGSFLPAASHLEIGKIHSHGLKYNMSIPYMAVIGNRSSGKSSVLEALTKLSFPRDKEMHTRFTTVVNLQHNPTLPRDVMSAKIEGEEEFNKRFAAIEAPMTFGSVIEEAMNLICKDIDISDKVLEITLSGPAQSPLIVVDLPGYIDTILNDQDKNLPDTIRAINRRFIQDPRTIILAVVPANADLENSRSLSEAGAYDPDGERTIPIVTKPDRIEGGLLPDWIEVVLNRRKTMKIGYFAMRNAGFEQRVQSWNDSCLEEEKFFETDMWSSIPPERKGRVAIREFLSKVQHEHAVRVAL
ncbi:MAG: P-loop containing nucleoside triphosphate hydrolase protein [Linnemannia gamsii]|nr:MAG: P-loop containing nucleoside triphosphate hydrolase protein [Linnemannia gamsii]